MSYKITARIARSGLFLYRADELDVDTTATFVKVWRPDEAMFDEATMQSFEGIPITLGHPDSMDKADIRGTANNVRREGDWLVADLVFEKEEDAKLAATQEFSIGFDYDLEVDGDHAMQTGIVGEHVAMVNRGRCGRGCATRGEIQMIEETTKRKGNDCMGAVIETEMSEKDKGYFEGLFTKFFGGAKAHANDAEPTETSQKEKTMDDDKKEATDEEEDKKTAEDEADDDKKKAEDEDDSEKDKAEDEEDDDEKRKAQDEEEAKLDVVTLLESLSDQLQTALEKARTQARKRGEDRAPSLRGLDADVVAREAHTYLEGRDKRTKAALEDVFGASLFSGKQVPMTTLRGALRMVRYGRDSMPKAAETREIKASDEFVRQRQSYRRRYGMTDY